MIKENYNCDENVKKTASEMSDIITEMIEKTGEFPENEIAVFCDFCAKNNIFESKYHDKIFRACRKVDRLSAVQQDSNGPKALGI